MWNKLTNYIYKNMMCTLTIAFLLSLTTPFIYEWSQDMNEWFPHANTAFVICVNVSYSIIASYIFYIINIFIPNRQEYKNRSTKIAFNLACNEYNWRTLEKSLNISLCKIRNTTLMEKLIDCDPDFPQTLTIGRAMDNNIGTPRLSCVSTIYNTAYLIQSALERPCVLSELERFELERILNNIPSFFRNEPRLQVILQSMNLQQIELANLLMSLRRASLKLFNDKKLPPPLVKEMELALELLTDKMEKTKNNISMEFDRALFNASQAS